MENRSLIGLIIVSTLIFILIIYLIIRYCHRSKKPQQQPIQRASSIENGITKLHQQENMFSNKRRTNYYVLRRGLSSKPLFNWSDNPNLVTDAVENGWSRFGFTSFTSSASVRKSSMLGCSEGKDNEMVDIGWDVCEGSVDVMQKIRFSAGSKKTGLFVKSALPLPGPALPNMPFPQEAYFEITILSSSYVDEVHIEMNGKTKVNKGKEEKVKLIRDNGVSEKESSDSLIHVTSSKSNCNGNGNNVNTRGGFAKVEELKGQMESGVVLSVGLTSGGSVPLKVPGSYPGSIGFNSDGSVYLEGVKLATELESDEWGKPEKVIGCGYNPSQNNVYFTVDAKLVREVHCTPEEFGTPLYPILASNSNVTVLVNLGQSIFKYTQANLHRTPNPCFIGQSTSSPILGYEDSRELFSMGRIDAHWLDRSTKRNAQYFGSVNRGMTDYDESSDGDLFEIVLDNNSRGRSPSMHF